jgi:hypothetical protein
VRLVLLLPVLALGLAANLASCGSSGGDSNGGGGSGGSGGSGSSGGSGGGGGGGTGGSGGYGPFEANHAPFPQVVDQGGPILTNPQIVTVTFPGDSMTAELQSFGETLEASTWWSTVTTGYCEGSGGACIGQGSAAKNVVFSSAPASSYTDSEEGGSSTLREWLVDSLSSGALPAPEAGSVSNTIYVIYFPTTTTIQLDSLKSCVQFDGYHGAANYGSQQIPYAVIPECSGPGAGNVPPITTLQNTTITASHEIVEATTDPSDTQTAYYLDYTSATPAGTEDNLGWIAVEGGGEVADICIDPFLLDQDETAEGSFTVQRIWSNAHAAAGLDPCNPVPSQEVYFNAAPSQSYFVLDVGASVTFQVNAFSTAARDGWTLTMQDWSDLGSTTAPTYLGFSIEGGMASGDGETIAVNNGTTVNVTMTLETDPSNLSTLEAVGSVITFAGTPTKPTAAHFWPLVVLTPSAAGDAGLDASLSSSKTGGAPLHHFRARPRYPFALQGGRTPRSLLATLAGRDGTRPSRLPVFL